MIVVFVITVGDFHFRWRFVIIIGLRLTLGDSNCNFGGIFSLFYLQVNHPSVFNSCKGNLSTHTIRPLKTVSVTMSSMSFDFPFFV